MKSSNFIINFLVYPFDVMISVNETDKQLKKEIKKFGLKWDNNLKLKPNSTGICMQYETGQIIIRLLNFKNTNENYGTLQHEIFHAVHFLMKRIGIKLCMNSSEAYAYAIQFLTEKIYGGIR
jgi:hypothetical protein